MNNRTPKNTPQNTTPIIKTNNTLDAGDRIALMDIYFRELEHRSNTLWSQAARFFVATITIIMLPNLTTGLGISLPQFPEYLFRVIGLVMSLFFMYVTWTYSKKVQASSKTYSNMMSSFPKEYRRVQMQDLPYGKFAVARTSFWVCFVMFLALFLTSVIFIVLQAITP